MPPATNWPPSPEFSELYPIRSWFIPKLVPQGEAPASIRARWVGVPLPLRKDRPIEGPNPKRTTGIFSKQPMIMEDAMEIRTRDAIKALHVFDRAEAAQWWNGHLENGDVGTTLYFHAVEGVWLPLEAAARLMPGLDEFDTV